MRKILPAITTTSGSDWRKKIYEANDLGLEEVCFFLTCLESKERKEFYDLIKKTTVRRSPFVHLRSDMRGLELGYLRKNYDVKVFNIHSPKEYPLLNDYLGYKKDIFIENIYVPLDIDELKEYGGVCLDLAHLENDRILEKDKFDHNVKILKKTFIGCNHISCIKKESRLDESGRERYDCHVLDNFSELDYLKHYPKNYFSDYIAIELENSLKEQLEIISYLKKFVY